MNCLLYNAGDGELCEDFGVGVEQKLSTVLSRHLVKIWGKGDFYTENGGES